MYSLGIQAYARGYSGQRITESLKELSSILDTHISRMMIDTKEWDPEKNPERPEIEIEDEEDPSGEDDDKTKTTTNSGENSGNNPQEPTKKGCKSSLSSSMYLVILLTIMSLIIVFKKQIYIRRKR